MNLNHELLLVFKTAIETNSFSAAARKLGKAPSAISMAISQLEDELDLNLFDRTKREPKPTAAAQSLYQSTLQTLAALQQWHSHALQLSNQYEPTLSIAFSTELESLKWTSIFKDFAEKFPLVTLEVITLRQQEALDALLSGRVHFAILLERQSLDNREQFIQIGQENIVAVVAQGHPLFNRSAHYEDLLQHRQVVFNRSADRNQSALQLSYHSWQTDNQYFAMDMIKAGLAWGFLPHVYVQSELDQGTLSILNLQDFSANLSFYVDLVWSREQVLGPAAHYFIALFQADANR